ncbi:MAG: hypothetical protein K1X72_06350 [Pyrinomonadaceae bacterium]|nr:hypothetical protein [Pyrinomonadaceae bacterium]
MKVKIFLVLIFSLIIGVFVWAKTAEKDKFSLAKDLPNGALVYLQVNDLPQVIKLWDESKLKEKYLDSQNFRQFQNSHLGIKLAERFTDLSEALGFQIDDAHTLSSLAENNAAIAIYDVGKLDIVFVAPMNETIFSATMFAQNSGNFEENELDDGTKFYSLTAEVDRQRQKQKVIFTNFKGRFILTTSEKLFLQTIAAINGKQRLYDEPNFQTLNKKISPNLATIWVNQEKLNKDYYFKRYWLMSEVEDLQNIRAGIFDLNLNENGLTEKREFLLKEAKIIEKISNAEAKDLMAKIPENVPFYRLQKADEKQLGEAIYDTFFDKQTIEKSSRNYSNNWSYNDDENYYGSDYEFLSSDFEKEINESEDDENIETKPFATNQISSAINSANPTTILTATSPKMLENPLFVEFRKAAIISLKNPNAFQANQFENSIVEALKNRVTVANTKFVWESESGLRKLKIPMLGWEIGYQVQGDKLLIANSFEFLKELSANKSKTEITSKDFSDLTVIRLTNRQENFDSIMKKLAFENSDFFTGNISSLLGVIDNVKEVEVKRDTENLYLHEEIQLKF